MSQRRILVVDDESIVAHDIAECLQQMGCEVVGHALSGPDAIAKAEHFRPDLVMMDIVLQGTMDGVEAATIIRQKLDIACVFLTAYSDGSVLARAKVAQPAGYMVKPFEQAGLRSTVEIALYKVDLERALRESKEWFMTTLMSIGDGVIATEPDGSVRFMNPLAEALTNWNSAEAAGRSIDEVFPITAEQSGQRVENPIPRALREGRIINPGGDTLLTRRDGTTLPVEPSAAPIRNGKGETVGAVLIFRDTTERRRTEAEVRKYQNHLEELVEARTSEIQKTNLRLVAEVEERTRAQQALAHRLQMEALVAETSAGMLQARQGETMEGIARALARIGQSLQAHRCYFMEINPPGDTVCRCLAEWCAEGAFPLQSHYQAVPVGAVELLAGPDGSLLALAQARDGNFPALANARGAESVIWLQLGEPDAPGGFLCLDWIGTRVEWQPEDTAFLKMVGDALLSALSRHRIEEEKAKLRDQLNQSMKMEAVGKLSGGIAHDFNNMLLPIIGYSDMILARLGPDDPSVMELKEIKSAAEKAAALTRQLLAFSRKQVIKKVVFDLSEAVGNMTRMLRRIIGENFELDIDLAPDPLPVKADMGQLEQVAMNLVVNARDAMPGGGKIVVRTTLVDASAQEVPLIVGKATTGHFVCFSVEDRGVGIPEDIRARIFEPFFTTKGMEGTGLGLSVIYGIIQDHQGGIEVDSIEKKGTTFRIYLPAAPLNALPKKEPAVSGKGPAFRGTGQRVLLVEDEEAVNRMVQTALTQNGYNVISASCVTEAMRLFDQNSGKFDMIFSDAVLPDGNGVQLLDIFLSRNPDLRALLSSGYTDKTSLLQMAQQRRISFLPKPYSLPALFQTVAEVMEDQNSHLLV